MQASASAHALKQWVAPELATQVLKQVSGGEYPQIDATAEGLAVAAQLPAVDVGVPAQTGLS